MIWLSVIALRASPGVSSFQIVSSSLQSNSFILSINSATGCVYTLQTMDGIPGYWSDVACEAGNGGDLSFTNQPDATMRFYRVAGAPAGTLALFPAQPRLDWGAVSLPDAVAGAAYAFAISPVATGTGPYNVQISNTPPDGISLSILGINTSQFRLELNSAGTNLVAGQRRQFTVTVTDAAGTNLSRVYDLRVIAAAPQILPIPIVLKAGATTNVVLHATNGEGALTWSLVSGAVPEGMTFSTNGVFSGTPTADAAELNENGIYTTIVQVADGLTDRVAGQPIPRRTSLALPQLVRLSYRYNLHTNRPNAPPFTTVCIGCHDDTFPPDFGSNSALDIIGVSAGSGGECSPGFNYVTPGSPSGSLIYRKVADAPCGERMPLKGDYLNAIQINRIYRWINELTDNDDD